MKTELLCSVFKKICVHTYRFRSVFACPHYNAVSIWKTLLYPHAQMNISIYRPAKLKSQGSICLPFWILAVKWSGTWSSWPILMMSPFSDSIVFSVHTRKQHFQKASFSNCSTLESVFKWLHFRHCSVDNSRIRSETALFSFEYGLVWMGPQFQHYADSPGFGVLYSKTIHFITRV